MLRILSNIFIIIAYLTVPGFEVVPDYQSAKTSAEKRNGMEILMFWSKHKNTCFLLYMFFKFLCYYLAAFLLSDRFLSVPGFSFKKRKPEVSKSLHVTGILTSL